MDWNVDNSLPSSDAAHTIHPLAGLGVNLGFGDVIILTEILKTAVAMGADIGMLNITQ